MANNTGITIEGIDDCLRAFGSLEGELRKNANGELRRTSKAIAAGLVPLLGGSPSPQERAFLDAAAPKSDRYVVLAVPSRKPKLAGLRRTPAAEAKRLAWAIENGSGYAPFRSPPAGGLVARNRDKITARAVPQYTRAMIDIMRKYRLL